MSTIRFVDPRGYPLLDMGALSPDHSGRERLRLITSRPFAAIRDNTYER